MKSVSVIRSLLVVTLCGIVMPLNATDLNQSVGSSQGNAQSPVYGGTVLASMAVAKPRRTKEEIELVFDKNKGSIFKIYNSALRTDSTLAGKVVFELEIAPAGQVSSVRAVYSELNAPELENKLADKIKGYNFGAKKVEALIVNYPIQFFPS